MFTPIIANAGFPILMLQVPLMVLLLYPVIAIEASFFIKYAGVIKHDAWKSSIAGNFITTLIGVPLTWFFLYCLQMYFMKYFHLYTVPNNNEPHTTAMLYLIAPFFAPYSINGGGFIPAVLILFVPYYYVSVYIESLIAYLIVRRVIPISKLIKVSKRAHLVTYGIMVAFVLFLGIFTIG